jgi:hypothetical protein
MMMMTMMMWENSFQGVLKMKGPNQIYFTLTSLLLQILGWGVSEAKNRERREWDFG